MKTAIESVTTSSTGQVINVTHDYSAMDEAAAVAFALECENREEFWTPGKFKSLGAAGASLAASAVGQVSPFAGKVVGAAVPTFRAFHTVKVIGKLEALQQNSSLSNEALDDLAYILHQKNYKLDKAGVGAFSPVATVVGILHWFKKNRGVERMNRATRIYDRFMMGDKGYLAIVEALFTNKPKPSDWMTKLRAADEELAIIVIMGKIASR